MRPVTDAFLATLRGAHKMVARATLVTPGQVGVTPIGIPIPGVSDLGRLPILGGDVTVDATADVQATLDLTTIYPWPTHPADPGTPYGQEIYVERGVEYGLGTTEWVGLGYFRIDSAEQSGRPDGSIRIAGSDRMAKVRDARAWQPAQFGAGTSVGALIDQVVQDALPTGQTLVSVYDWPAYTDTIGTVQILDEDRLAFLQDVVASRGKVAYWDYAGRLQVKNAPTTSGAPVWTVNRGAGGVLVSVNRKIDRDGVYNAVVARGDATGELPPVQGIAYDNNPSSPTYWDGPFGLVPRFYASSFITTTAQAGSAAASILAQSSGLPYTVSFETVPNPALETGDVVSLLYSDAEGAENHILDRITYALTPDGAMAADTRKQVL
ncbi:DUF5047 domain-containing protein [Amycolatopsis sp. NBC_01480]|uniref:DUF5047 domain-containing protein n=1 Tax=Amycolatopsis sp. NBC_01480 TaxID=2903562 RepID=UPI002E2CCA57|nr:DUF5047 domain-containing protein [Amycolatopsis sp. NBC_01480]